MDAAAKPKEAYATQEARVLSAEPRISRQKPKLTLWSTFGDLLLSWGPMFLLIGVWIYFMQRMRRKDSPQERSIALLQQQVELSKVQSQFLAQIATALEALATPRRDS
jgi:ATP-dependent Zn protease